MKLKDYLRDRRGLLISVFIMILLIVILLTSLKQLRILNYYIPFIIISCLSIYLVLDYIKIKNYYATLKYLNTTDIDKSLLHEMLSKPVSNESEILFDTVYRLDKFVRDNLNELYAKNNEYKEYIELWCHEIKTPIATSKLVIENNKNKSTLSVLEEINKVDNLIDQVLFYSRSDYVEKDYLIKEVDIKSVIDNTVIKNKKQFIDNNFEINNNVHDETILSDSKWLEFILNQIINNAIKYKRTDNCKIDINVTRLQEKLILSIKDNGIGIDNEDIKRVFDKGFTGNNGRSYNKSTGIGLYLVKKLCNKLGHEAVIESVKNEYTNVSIIFPIGSFTVLHNC